MHGTDGRSTAPAAATASGGTLRPRNGEGAPPKAPNPPNRAGDAAPPSGAPTRGEVLRLIRDTEVLVREIAGYEVGVPGRARFRPLRGADRLAAMLARLAGRR